MGSYNGSYDRSIGMAPNIVMVKDNDRIWRRLYGDGDTYLKRLRNVKDGVKVWISRDKSVFDNGYMLHWSREQFTVTSMVPQADKKVNNSRPVYTFKDDGG